MDSGSICLNPEIRAKSGDTMKSGDTILFSRLLRTAGVAGQELSAEQGFDCLHEQPAAQRTPRAFVKAHPGNNRSGQSCHAATIQPRSTGLKKNRMVSPDFSAPARANAIEMAAPMPRPPPVTSAIFVERSMHPASVITCSFQVNSYLTA